MLHDWLKDVFTYPASLEAALAIAGKTTVIYFFLIVGLRLMGKRELGQMNIYDLVLILVLANAVQNSMVGDDSSLLGGIIAATTLLILNRLFTLLLAKSRKVEHLMVGEPSLIVSGGKILTDRLHREGVTRDQLLAALREHGLDCVEQAQMCVLEVDGSISVVPTGTEVHRSRRHYKALRLP